MFQAIDLFAGAGGLALGISLAGFSTLAVLEWNRWACDTLRENQRRRFPALTGALVYEGDVRDFDWTTIPEGIDLISGGPPCQPFSMGGKHRAHGDSRDMFPATVDIIRKVKPKAFLIENVKGLTRSSFSNYFQYILLQLEFPDISPRPSETWTEHLSRLQNEKTSGNQHFSGLSYNIVTTLANVADYGVPQRRERVFIVGFRSDLGVEWSFPKATHSLDALLRSQWITEEYWDNHPGACRYDLSSLPALSQRVKRLQGTIDYKDFLPWRTVRDAFARIPIPTTEGTSQFYDHFLQPGARAYPGHTGSMADMPAKTLKAGDHGVPGGENMLLQDDGTFRYFSVRESARLQTFPDTYTFHGSWTEAMRQLGNAVPVSMARKVASSISERLAEKALTKLAEIERLSAI